MLIETIPHARDAANKLAAHDDLLKQIDHIRDRLTHLKSSALLHANNKMFEQYGAVHLAAWDADNMLADLAGDVRPDRKEIDDALTKWAEIEAYDSSALAGGAG